MKNLILIVLVFTSTNLFAQTVKDRSQARCTSVKITPSRDTSLKVIIVDKEKQRQQPVYFINGQFVRLLGHIKSEHIESIDITKGDILIGNQTYNGQIHIKTKAGYSPKLISLSELKYKYTSFKETPVVFMLNTDIINSDQESYFIDENDLLTIIVDKLTTNKDNVEIGLITLLTTSKKNIDSRNAIIIRGEEIAAK
ncbi:MULTISPECIES: hypothetical protein [Sphingobacterium]|uniref:hypothetical protein n=1 Tax=Sphingobacterium TaxID=28453 RepID=UPI0013D9F12B|nr:MULTISPECIES: hypothetical protein [unclassified Sphingobacterium]